MLDERSYQSNLLVFKHLLERSKNYTSDAADWDQLMIRHRDEVEMTGLTKFNGWDQQRNNIAQLKSFQFEKRVVLEERQRKEYCRMIENDRMR
ncbi:hypothetical protein LC612_40420 [Nostoc sp. CHAB 5834]|nr:hypothetical protein [Nostoc sp. CHAB 5834]